jgi:hypothetical protein
MRAHAGGDLAKTWGQARTAIDWEDASPLLTEAALVTDWKMLLDQRRKLDANPMLRDAYEKTIRAARKKAAIPIATTGDPVFASPLLALETLQRAWFASLRNESMLDAIAAGGMMPLPSGIIFAVTTAIGSGHGVLEAAWKPVTRHSFGTGITKAKKAMGLVVLSNDMLRFGGPLCDAVIKTEFRNAVSLAADEQVVAALVDGLTPISGGSDPRVDLRKMLAAVPTGQLSRLMLFAAPELLKQMSVFGTADGPCLFPDLTAQGGSVQGIPTLPSDALTAYAGFGSPASSCLVLVDCSQLAGDAGILEYTVSEEASIEMVDNFSPTSPEDEPAASNLVSMFQTSSTALLSERYFVISRAREAAVAVVSGANYDPS